MGLQRGNNLLNRIDPHSRRASSKLKKCKLTISANYKIKFLFKKKKIIFFNTFMIFLLTTFEYSTNCNIQGVILPQNSNKIFIVIWPSLFDGFFDNSSKYIVHS